MNQPSQPISRRPSSPFNLTVGALAVSLMLAACGGGTPTPPDTTAPTVAITDNAAGTATGAVTFTFTFSEDVGTTFTAEDVTVAGGNVGAFAKLSATVYTLVVTPPASAAGSMAVSVAAAKFKDLALNDNTASASADQAYDTTTPPAPTGTVLASFDETTALAFSGFDGAESSSIAASPAGGTGLAAKIIRLGGQVWAGAKVNVGVIPLTTTNNTISARVYSPTAGVPMVLKLENATDAGINSGDIQATQTVVAGWQTLTWVVPAAKIGPSYSWVVMLPNLGTKASVDPGETYYFDDIKLLGTPASGGGGGGGSTPNPGAAQGSFGPVPIPVLTSPDSMGFAGTGDAVFAGDYIGALDANNKRAGWAGATTNGLANNGNIGYFQDTALSTSAQKLEENGWVAGLTDNPGGVPSFFRYVILTAPGSTFASSYLGVFANAPNNGTVNVSSYGNIKFRLWGPAEMYQNNNFNPQLEVTLAGAKVTGCTTTGSGGTEIKKTFSANQKIGAASTYKLPLAAWTVVGVCGTDTTATAVASVLGALARVVVTVPGTSFNFTNANAGGTVVTYATGVNLGPIAFTNN